MGKEEMSLLELGTKLVYERKRDRERDLNISLFFFFFFFLKKKNNNFVIF